MPKWTVITNLTGKWIGTSWEFFDEENEAEACYQKHLAIGNVPTKPYFNAVDSFHLGAVHRMNQPHAN